MGCIIHFQNENIIAKMKISGYWQGKVKCTCLLYTSDAADERSSVDLGGRRIIKKKTTKTHKKTNKKKKKKKKKI